MNEPSKPNLRFTGRQVPAQYRIPLLEEDRGNAYLEALPEVPPTKDAIREYLTVVPYTNTAELQLPPELRIQRTSMLNHFLIPDDNHIDVFRTVYQLTRTAYLGRNPQTSVNITKRNEQVHEAAESALSGKVIDVATLSASLFGLSRVGKSLAVFRSLDYFPQVINHNFYAGRKFTRRQLVWLYQDCVFDGRPGGLITIAYLLIDAILRTNHYKDFAKDASIDRMLGGFYTLCPNLGLGLWVLDELQVLYSIKSTVRKIRKMGNPKESTALADQLINMLVMLSNVFGVGLLFVGTPPAKYVLAQKFRFLCRASAEGIIDWTSMDEHSVAWSNFVYALASMPLLQHPVEPSKISHRLYLRSGGIAGVAVMVYKAAVKYAIDQGTENITEKEIETVFKKYFSDLESPLQKLLDHDLSAADEWEDLFFKPEYSLHKLPNAETRKPPIDKIHNNPGQPSTTSPIEPTPQKRDSKSEASTSESPLTNKTFQSTQLPTSYEDLQKMGYVSSLEEMFGKE